MDQRYNRSVWKPATSSGLICLPCRTRRIRYANLTLYWSLLAKSEKNVIYSLPWKIQNDTVYLIIIQSYCLTSHCGLQLDSSHIRRELILCQCLRCEPEHQRSESVLLQEILIWPAKRREWTDKITQQFQKPVESQEGWTGIENWNNIINFDNDGTQKKQLYFHKQCFHNFKQFLKGWLLTKTVMLWQVNSYSATLTNTAGFRYGVGIKVKNVVWDDGWGQDKFMARLCIYSQD